MKMVLNIILLKILDVVELAAPVKFCICLYLYIFNGVQSCDETGYTDTWNVEHVV